MRLRRSAQKNFASLHFFSLRSAIPAPLQIVSAHPGSASDCIRHPGSAISRAPGRPPPDRERMGNHCTGATGTIVQGAKKNYAILRRSSIKIFYK